MRLLRPLRLLEDRVKLEEKCLLQEALAREEEFFSRLLRTLRRLAPLLSTLWNQAALAVHEEHRGLKKQLMAKDARDRLTLFIRTPVDGLAGELFALGSFLDSYGQEEYIFYEVQKELLRELLEELQELYGRAPKSLVVAFDRALDAFEPSFLALSRADDVKANSLLKQLSIGKLRLHAHEGPFAAGLVQELTATIKRVLDPSQGLEELSTALELHLLLEGYEPLTPALQKRLYTRPPPTLKEKLQGAAVGHYADNGAQF